MAISSKKIFEGVKEHIATEVIRAETEEQPESRGGIWTQEDINTIKDAAVKAEVQKRFNEYVAEARSFNEARKRMMEKKYRLQNVLDGPFTALGLVSASQKWTIHGLDRTGNNIVYRDDDKNYKVKYDRQQRRREGKSTVNVKFRDADWDSAWGFAAEDMRERDKDTLQDTPQGMSDDAFDQEMQTHLTEFNKLRATNTRYNYFNVTLTLPSQRNWLWMRIDADKKKDLEPYKGQLGIVVE